MVRKSIKQSSRDPLTKRLFQCKTKPSMNKTNIKTRPFLYKYIISKSKCCYSCVCGKEFYEKTILREHLGVCKTADIVRFCRLCKILYPNLDALVTHRIHTHGTSCSACGKRFISDRLLAKHRERWHAVHECQLCGKTYNTGKNYSRHVRCHTVPYSCSICKLKFSTGTYLKEHTRSVHGGMKFWCKECGNVYTQRASLRKHILEKHKGKRYYCAFCPKCYTRKSMMMKHTLSVHGEGPKLLKLEGIT